MTDIWYNRWEEPPSEQTKKKLNMAVEYMESLIAPHRFKHRFPDAPRFGELEQYRTKYFAQRDDINDIPDLFVLRCRIIVDEPVVDLNEFKKNIDKFRENGHKWLINNDLTMQIHIGITWGYRPVSTRLEDYEAAKFVDENFTDADGNKILEAE